MDLLDLPETEIEAVKTQLMADGTIFESNKVKHGDTRFFETVTVSNTLIKFLLFFSVGLYAVINVLGNLCALIWGTGDVVGSLEVMVGIFMICFIVIAIFSNINTNKKKEENVMFVNGKHFIFNFNDGVTETPKLFYRLPYERLEKIEFLIYRCRKEQLFGCVTFTFRVLDYQVTHTIRYTNLTKIEQCLQQNFPALLGNLVVDGKSEKYHEPTKNKPKLKCMLIALALVVAAVFLIVLPRLWHFESLALTVVGVLFIITAVVVFSSFYLYTYFMVQGVLVSCVFLIMGICVPWLIVEISGVSFVTYLLYDPQILMPTIFGIIGLCLYSYQLIIWFGKIHYQFRRPRTRG